MSETAPPVSDTPPEKQERIKVFKLGLRLMLFRPYFEFCNFFAILAIYLPGVITPIIIKEVFNKIEGISALDIGLWIIVMFIPITFFFRFLGDLLGIVVWAGFEFSAKILLRRNLLDKILSKPGAEPLIKSSGEALSRFRGDVMETVFFSMAVAERSANLLVLAFSLTLMGLDNAMLTLYVSLPFCAMIFITYFVRTKLSEYRRAARKATGEVTSTLGKLFGSIQVYKVATAEENVLKYFKRVNEKRGKAAIKDESFWSVLTAVFQITIAISIGIILILVIPLMQGANLSIGDFYFFFWQLYAIANNVWGLGTFASNYQRAKVSYERLLLLSRSAGQVVSQEELVKHKEIYVKKPFPAIPPLTRGPKDHLQSLEVRGLSYSFGNSSKGIFDIDLTLQKGTFTVVTGRIGSGKTTLLRVLQGLLPADTGEILWNGVQVQDPSSFFVPPRSAYTSQIPHLFSESIKENILLGLPEESVPLSSALQLAVFDEDVAAFENGLDTIVGPKGVMLSGGQRQRLATARMFVREPELFIFDDLSSALDVETEHKLWTRLFKEYKTGTFLVVSHRPVALQRADKIIVLDKGQVVGRGTLEELLQDCDEMKKLYQEVAQVASDVPSAEG